MDKPSNLQMNGLIVSSIMGVLRINSNGERQLQIGELPSTDKVTTTAWSLIPENKQYPSPDEICRRVEDAEYRGMGAIVRR